MSNDKLVFYYLTEDLSNLKERNELEYLARAGRVVLVSRGSGAVRMKNVKQLRLPAQTPEAARLYLLWSKLCYLLCRIANSASDQEFPSRNFYNGGPVLRSLVNGIWRFKRLACINRLLPSYDSLYFSPLRLAMALSTRGRLRPGRRTSRVLVHDSLVLRLAGFAPLIAAARRAGIPTIANVKSWDNPYYSQFASGADGFLVWSRSMWADVRYVHDLPERPVHVWGARPFFRFVHAVRSARLERRRYEPGLRIGYAAAFCDSIMLEHEIAVLKTIAAQLEVSLPGSRLLVRPYPTLPLSCYAPLAQCGSVDLQGIKGEVTDRFNDGRELIRFGSDEERIEYLTDCDCFLSLATSFTIEAAVAGLPIVHFFMRPEECATSGERLLFQRIDISDHLKSYFNQYLLVARNYAELAAQLGKVKADPTLANECTRAMLHHIGIPAATESWNASADSLAETVPKGIRTA